MIKKVKFVSIPVHNQDRAGTYSGISFSTDDLEKTYAELKIKGVKFRGPPEKQPWGTFAVFEDSEGNQFVISADR